MPINAKERLITSHTFQPPRVTEDPGAAKKEAVALQKEVQKEREKRLAELELAIEIVIKLVKGVEFDRKRFTDDPSWAKKLSDDRAQYNSLKELMLARRDQIRART